MKLIQFKPEHIYQLNIQSKQSHIKKYLDQSNFGILDGVTVLDDAGHVLFVGGCQLVYGNRYLAWSVFSEESGKHMLALVRRIRVYLNKYILFHPQTRIECTCDVNFPAAHRLAQLLGFQIEAPLLRYYEIDGRDSTLYALTNNEFDKVFK